MTVRSSLDADVAIVGYGPVGQALALMLGRAGHRVAVFERYQQIYRLPRAVHLDHEIMRLLQALGLGGMAAEHMVEVPDYQWFGADGELLIKFEMQNPSPSAWSSDYMFFQPELEAELDRLARARPSVTVHTGWAAEALSASDKGGELTVRELATGKTRTVRAAWVVGADGANSFVREAMGISRRDLGFQERWLVVDTEPRDMASLAHLPVACQWCNPARPTTHVRSGPRHHRWEFMLLPGEQPADLEDPARVWALLEPWYRPDDGPVTRHTVYEFRSMLADCTRLGRVLLVGDAAHLTPPFLGQGLCAGLRDAVNVAWKLDLVLRGLAGEGLLDTVDPERQPQNEAVISLAVELGRILCELDPQAAAERDAIYRGQEPPPIQMLPLLDGAIHRPAAGTDPLAGALSLQGVVARGGVEGFFDDVVGAGFQLIASGGDPLLGLSSEDVRLVDVLGVKVASLDAEAPAGIRDVDGRLTAWLAEQGAHAVLVRPDFYVFGSAPSQDQVPALLQGLRTGLRMTPNSIAQEV